MRSNTHSSGRKVALAGLLLVASLAGAVPAMAQTGGTGSPGSTTTPTTTTTTPTAPGSTAQLLPSGKALPPAGAPRQIRKAIKAGNRIHKKPYIWGGGHRSFKAKGYDCSGAVSYVLHAARLLSFPLVSGQLASWGSPGPGSWITVYANRTHTYMVIAGLRYDTSPRGEWIDQGRGPRWRFTLRTGNGFAVRHYPGL